MQFQLSKHVLQSKIIETKFYCKTCGESDMSPNVSGNFVKGWRCNICNSVSYPTIEKLNRVKAAKKSSNI